MLFFITWSSACACRREITTSGSSSSQPGVTVTKEVPSAKETVGEIHEREIREPLPPQEERVIPFHRIPRDNTSLPAQ